jgi:hypothetical protein
MKDSLFEEEDRIIFLLQNNKGAFYATTTDDRYAESRELRLAKIYTSLEAVKNDQYLLKRFSKAEWHIRPLGFGTYCEKLFEEAYHTVFGKDVKADEVDEILNELDDLFL